MIQVSPSSPPFFEFRFPEIGRVNVNNIELELRSGIEPWNVLGEEMTGGGTSRYVDSSLERIQVKVKNFVNDRYVLTCNSIKVQLKPTAVKGEYVAGIRYKAWNPYSALHPTIDTDTPLVFDIVDTWNKKSVGGCIYFVSHPGGRSYDNFPINSLEAESRRINRFWDFGQAQSDVEHVPELKNEEDNSVRNFEEKASSKRFKSNTLAEDAEFPNTLDLRKKK